MSVIAKFRTPKSREQFAKILGLLMEDNLEFATATPQEDGSIEMMFTDCVGEDLGDLVLVPMTPLEADRYHDVARGLNAPPASNGKPTRKAKA